MTAKSKTKRARRRGAAEDNQNGSLTSVAYNAIKGEILGNRLKAGEALPTERFIRELKLSRTPLREAILRLEREGFVEVRPRMGTFVSHLNLREIQDMYQVRRELEGLAARLAAGRVNAERLAEVEKELTRHSLKGKVNYEALSEAGQGLHRLVVESCGNRVLAQFIRSLQDHFARFRSLSLNLPEKIVASHREHLGILAALKAGDGKLAERLVHEHFDHAGRTLLDSLLKDDRRREHPPLTVALG
ncbi:MAG: GntR family transcriptional regulator [Blastocatellia bacterium]